MTTIEWTDETWNPTTGCDRISPGCDNCYALTMAKRLKAMGSAKYQTDGDPRTSGPGFGLACHPDTLTEPHKWRKPRRVFVDSMSDLFHPDVPIEFIGRVWRTMTETPQHTYQILTKRPQRMASIVNQLTSPVDGIGGQTVDYGVQPNVWLGTSIESDKFAWRANHLRDTPAAIRFLSLEPLLGPLPSLDLTGIDWVIVGGESGPGARPMHPDWVRDIRDRSADQGVAFFFKQWGAWSPNSDAKPEPDAMVLSDGSIVGPGDEVWFADAFAAAPMARVGKKKAGRILDGRTHDDYPTKGDHQ